MYRDELPPATLLPVPRALDVFMQADAPRVNDAVYDVPAPARTRDEPARRASPVFEHSLPFRVSVLCNESQLLLVQA